MIDGSGKRFGVEFGASGLQSLGTLFYRERLFDYRVVNSKDFGQIK